MSAPSSANLAIQISSTHTELDLLVDDERVYSQSTRRGTAHLEELVLAHLAAVHNAACGEQELVLRGPNLFSDPQMSLPVRDLSTGLARTAFLDSGALATLRKAWCEVVVDAVATALNRAPPEILDALRPNSVAISSVLPTPPELRELLQEATGLSFTILPYRPAAGTTG